MKEEKIIKTPEVHKDYVFDRLHSLGLNKDFLYNVNNECYKGYTMINSLKNEKRKNENENIQESADENKEETIDLTEREQGMLQDFGQL